MTRSVFGVLGECTGGRMGGGPHARHELLQGKAACVISRCRVSGATRLERWLVCEDQGGRRKDCRRHHMGYLGDGDGGKYCDMVCVGREIRSYDQIALMVRYVQNGIR